MQTKTHTVNKQSRINMATSDTHNVSVNNDESLNESDPLDIVVPNKGKENVRRHSCSNSDDSNKRPKKIRKKPEPKIIENMKEYYKSDTLTHLTTTTLRHWLKQQKVHCTTRDNKTGLMEKVKNHILENHM